MINVASLAEAWIEITILEIYVLIKLSPPSRRRGLKFFWRWTARRPPHVASLAEAWIEIDSGDRI